VQELRLDECYSGKKDKPRRLEVREGSVKTLFSTQARASPRSYLALFFYQVSSFFLHGSLRDSLAFFASWRFRF
jgi:hypothetical protein